MSILDLFRRRTDDVMTAKEPPVYVHLRLIEGGPVRADVEFRDRDGAKAAARAFRDAELYAEVSPDRAELVPGTWSMAESLRVVELESLAFLLLERCRRNGGPLPVSVSPFIDAVNALRWAHTRAHPIDPHLAHKRDFAARASAPIGAAQGSYT